MKEELPVLHIVEHDIGAISWLKAVRDCVGTPVVFALDEALMCHGSFGGRSDEYTVWLYGDDSAMRFNGVVILGNHISSYTRENKPPGYIKPGGL